MLGAERRVRPKERIRECTEELQVEMDQDGMNDHRDSIEELERELRRHLRALNTAVDRALQHLHRQGKIETDEQGSPETAPPDSAR